jgi:hypothetical protein
MQSGVAAGEAALLRSHVEVLRARQPPADAAALTLAAGALARCAAQGEAGALAVVEAGALEAVVALLVCDASVTCITGEACIACCDLLRQMSKLPSFRVRMAEAGAIEALTAALARHATHADVTCAQVIDFVACETFLRLWDDEDSLELRRSASAAGAVEAVMAAVARSSGAESSASAACTALAKLTYDIADARQRAIAAGALPALVRAMVVHATSHTVQNSGVVALVALVLADDDEVRIAAAELGAIPVLLAALRAHGANADTAANACKALAMVLSTVLPANRARVAGVASVLVGAMQSHAAHSRVQADAAAALLHLFLTDTAATAAAGDAGAAFVLARALRTFADDAETAPPISCVRALFILAPAKLSSCIDARVAPATTHAAFEALAAAAADGAAGGASSADAPINAELHETRSSIVEAACSLLAFMAHAGVLDAVAPVAGADALELALRALHAPAFADVTAVSHAILHASAMRLLQRLLRGEGTSAHAARDARAVRAGAMQLVSYADAAATAQDPRLATELENAERDRVLIQRALHRAAEAHDAGACAVGEEAQACARCAAARASGAICALAGCGAHTRDGGGAKKLLRCGTCRAACYCSAAHQREDWGRHKH